MDTNKFLQLTTSQWSIILETISFFLVTLDLYGKQRLQNLSEYIKERIHIYESASHGKLIELAKERGLYNEQNEEKLNFMLNFFQNLFDLNKIIWNFFMKNPLFVVIDGILKFLYRILKKMADSTHVEGVLLLSGAILFIFSKLLSFFMTG
ncbi:MAG: hypothetical protein ACKV1O_24640 [Saprospiraceae bacterium]